MSSDLRVLAISCLISYYYSNEAEKIVAENRSELDLSKLMFEADYIHGIVKTRILNEYGQDALVKFNNLRGFASKEMKLIDYINLIDKELPF